MSLVDIEHDVNQTGLLATWRRRFGGWLNKFPRILLEQGRLVVCLPALMIAGTAFSKAFYQAGIFFGIGLFALVFLAWLKPKWRLVMTLPLIGVCAFCIGLLLLPIHAHLFATTMWRTFETIPIKGRVIELRDRIDGDHTVILDKLSSDKTLQLTLPKKVRLVMRFDNAPEIGDRLAFFARFVPVPKPVLPNSFDPQFHAFFDGIGAYGHGLSDTHTIAKSDTDWAVTLSRWRKIASVQIDGAISARAASFAKAIMVGDQSGINNTTRELFARTGLSHMLAISGLHLSLVAWAAYIALRRILSLNIYLNHHAPIRAISAMGGLGVAFGYLALSGFSISAMRATIMLAVIFLALLWGRRAITMRNVALSAVIIMMLDPASIFTASFQLSFAAVVGLVGFYETYAFEHSRSFSRWQRFFGYFKTIILASLIAGAFTAVPTLWHFGQAAPLGALANIVAMPIFALLVMPVCMLALILMPFGLERGLLHLAEYGIEWIYGIASWVDGLRFTADQFQQPSFILFAVFVIALLWFAVWPTRYRMAGFALLAAVLIAKPTAILPDVIVADRAQHILVSKEGSLNHVIKEERYPIFEDTLVHQFGAAIFRPQKKEEALGVLSCLEGSCTPPGYKQFNFAMSSRGLSNACASETPSAIVISRYKAPKDCNAEIVLDKSHFSKFGGSYIWINNGADFQIKSAISNPTAPWRVPIQ